MSTIVITIQSVDVTPDVMYPTVTFTAATGAFPGEFDLKIKDPDIAYDFETGNNITLDVDGVRCFDGYLTQIDQEFAFPVEDSVTKDPALIWHLRGPDVNILFQKRIVFDQDHPERQLPNRPIGTTDLEALELLVSDYIDIAADNLTTDFHEVGVINPDVPALPFAIGDVWQQGMFNISQLPGAVWGIKPDRTLYYEDDDTESAPFRLSDTPDNVTSFGYSDLSWTEDGTKLANDAPAWGAGYSNKQIVYARAQDAASIAEHGRWQAPQLFLGTVYRQTTITQISDSVVYGTPQNLHGGKDDAVFITCRVVRPGISPGDKVFIESSVFDISGVFPIRSMKITTPTPTDCFFDLKLTYEIDRRLTYFDPFKLPRTPPPPPPGGCLLDAVAVLERSYSNPAVSWVYQDAGISASGPPIGPLLPAPPFVSQPGGGTATSTDGDPTAEGYAASAPVAFGALSLTANGGGGNTSVRAVGESVVGPNLILDGPSLDVTIQYRLDIEEPPNYGGVNTSFVIGSTVMSVGVIVDGGYHSSAPGSYSDLVPFINGLSFNVVRESPGFLFGDPSLIPFTEPHLRFSTQTFDPGYPFVLPHLTVFGQTILNPTEQRITSTLTGSFGTIVDDRANTFQSAGFPFSMVPPDFFIRLRLSVLCMSGFPMAALRATLTVDQVVWRNVENCSAIGGVPLSGQISKGAPHCETPAHSGNTYTTSYRYIGGSLSVYLNGTRQRNNVDYIETSPSTFAFTAPIASNVHVFCCYQAMGS